MKTDGVSSRLRRCGISQRELAERLGFTIGAVAQGLRGDGRWAYRTLIELLELLTYEQRREWLETKRGKVSDDE